MKSEDVNSQFDKNISWLESNLGNNQKQKILSHGVESERSKKITNEDFELEYTNAVLSRLKSPRRISFIPIEATFNGDLKPQSVKEASCSLLGSTEFSLLSFLFSSVTSHVPTSKTTQNSHLLLLGSCALPGLVNQALHDIDNSNYQTIILVESSISSFLSVLHHIDFPHFIQRLKDLSISFNLILEDSFEVLTENIYEYFSKSNPFLIFGLDVVSQPLLNPTLVKIEDWILSQTGIGYRFASNLGFSTDELNQCINSFITYHQNPQITGIHSCSIQKKDLSIVTGSGPSLDENLDWIKKYQDSLTIYAAGSSVISLLSHGITPSFLVVQERDPIIYDYLLDVSLEYPEFSDIILLGSDTIDSRNYSLFDRFFVFQRPLSSVSPLFFEFRSSTLPTSGPESVNASVEAALMMGSSNILLLGCDFAAPNKSLVRSKNAFGLSPRDFDIPVRGNFQRTVYSQLSLLHAKQCLERVLEIFPTVNVMRCGEGVSLQNENLVSLSPDISPTDLLDSRAIPHSSSLIDCNLVDSTEKRLSAFVSSLTTYITSFNQSVQSCKCWDTQFERTISNFFSIDLNNNAEQPIDLAARRLLRHCFYHLTYQIYLSRASADDFSSAKTVLDSRASLLTDLITYIFETLKLNLDDISSSSDPYNCLKRYLQS